ncbi:hypothetical protein D4A39_16720, partial [Alcanivorax profundi]
RARKARAEAGAAPHELVNRSVAELHTDLPLEIEAKRQELAELKEKILKNEVRAEKARAKAEQDEDRAEKALKNAEIYERRASEAEGKVEGLEAQIIALERVEAAKGAAEAARDQALEAQKGAESRAEAAESRMKDLETGGVAAINEAASVAAQAAAAVITGGLYQNDQGKWKVGEGSPSAERLKPLWKHLRPALEWVALWWDDVRGKVTALPEPEQQAFFKEVPPDEIEEEPAP